MLFVNEPLWKTSITLKQRVFEEQVVLPAHVLIVPVTVIFTMVLAMTEYR